MQNNQKSNNHPNLSLHHIPKVQTKKPILNSRQSLRPNYLSSKPSNTTLNLRKKDEEKDTFDDVADMARSGYRLAKRLADLINVETKCYYYGQTTGSPVPVIVGPNNVTWSGSTPVTVNIPTVGDADFQRIADSIKIQHIDLIVHVGLAAQSGPNIPEIRVIMYWDETNSTNSQNQVLEDAFFATPLVTHIPKDWDEKASTKILLDEVYHTARDAALNAAGSNIDTKPFTFRHSMPINKHTQFENGSQTIVTGALKLFFVTNSSTNTPISWTVRTLFTDD